VIANAIILTLMVVVVIQVGRSGDSVSGELIWAVISTVGTIAAAAVGSNQLRHNARHGRRTALLSVAVMVGLRIVDLIVSGDGVLGSTGAPVSVLMVAGAFGVVVFGLLAPASMRTNNGSMPPTNPSADVLYSQVADYPGNGFAYSGPAQTLRAPTMAVEKQFVDPRATAAADPATSQAELLDIVSSRPDLRPAIALNPNTYPGLLDWLGTLGEPAVDAALASRRAQ